MPPREIVRLRWMGLGVVPEDSGRSASVECLTIVLAGEVGEAGDGGEAGVRGVTGADVVGNDD